MMPTAALLLVLCLGMLAGLAIGYASYNELHKEHEELKKDTEFFREELQRYTGV